MRSSRALRLAAVAAFVVVAAVIVGTASRPHSAELTAPAPQLGHPTIPLVPALAGALGLFLGSNEFLLLIPLPGRGAAVQDDKRRVPWALRLLLTFIPIMILLFAIAAARLWGNRNPQAAGRPGIAPQFAADTGGASGDVGLALACLVLVLAGILVATILFRRTGPILVLEPRARADEATVVLDEGLTALLAESDPRRAVIAAYVAMERAMARQGWARRPHEAPTEYLARVLRVAPARAGDLDNLVDLSELARFSEHTVTPVMREAAVESVRRLRADLREPS
jgi:hypothetical protein